MWESENQDESPLMTTDNFHGIDRLVRCSLGVALVTTGGCCSCGFRPQISLPNGTAVADYHREDGPSCPLGALFYSRQERPSCSLAAALEGIRCACWRA